MSVNGRYDGELQMLIEEPRDANREHLLFFRWLAEQGRLEHPVAGLPHAGLAQPSTIRGMPRARHEGGVAGSMAAGVGPNL